ncbi:MAG: endonuclease [Acidobacteria bacterium]|nr:endonuclease [Acidobacteriota bacterium]
MKITGTIYLLHFSQAFKHARHYVGFTTDLQSRLDAHSNGTGARLLEVITQAGLSFKLARIWHGTRQTERRLKNRKATPRLCPLCNPQAMRRARVIQ